jgi:hypothetical protein
MLPPAMKKQLTLRRLDSHQPGLDQSVRLPFVNFGLSALCGAQHKAEKQNFEPISRLSANRLATMERKRSGM